jgi:MFS family permease
MVAPADIFRWPVLQAGLLAFLANYAQFAVWLLAPYYLVSERGLSAAAGGLLFMLTPLAMAIAAPVAGRAADRWGARGPMAVGLAAEAAGLLFVARCGGFAFLSRTAGIVVGVQTAAWLFHDRAQILGFLPAFRFTFAAAAAVCAIAAVISLVRGRERAPRATRHEA